MSMTTDLDADAWLDASAAVLGLTVRPEDRDAVLANLRILAGMAATLETAEIDDRSQSATVFRP
ncbi:MAG: DUF4089 domain-containing protein [Azospirillaceae bacterium]